MRFSIEKTKAMNDVLLKNKRLAGSTDKKIGSYHFQRNSDGNNR